MFNLRVLTVAAMACLGLQGCAWVLRDDATRLATLIEKAATKLRKSEDTEARLFFEVAGTDKPYTIVMEPCFDPREPVPDCGPMVVRAGEISTSTRLHTRAVRVPLRMSVSKSGGKTEIVLKKQKNGRIEVFAMY